MSEPQQLMVRSKCVVRTQHGETRIFEKSDICFPDALGYVITRQKRVIMNSLEKKDALWGSCIGPFQTETEPYVFGSYRDDSGA